MMHSALVLSSPVLQARSTTSSARWNFSIEGALKKISEDDHVHTCRKVKASLFSLTCAVLYHRHAELTAKILPSITAVDRFPAEPLEMLKEVLVVSIAPRSSKLRQRLLEHGPPYYKVEDGLLRPKGSHMWLCMGRVTMNLN